MLISLLLFTVVVSLGLLAYFRANLWAYLLAIVAFLPSSCLFYGNNDYAIRSGLLFWLFLGLIQKRKYRIRWLPILSLWIVMAIGGVLITYYNIRMWPPILIYVFTHSGFSFLYVLLVAVIIPGRVKIEHYLTLLVKCMIFFFVIGGFIQYTQGVLFKVSADSARYLSESYNYFTVGGRLVGLFQASSHATAAVLNVGFGLLLAKIHYQRRSFVLNGIMLALIISGIVLCQNRGNYLAVIITVIVYLYITKKNKKYFALTITLLFLLVLIITVVPSHYISKTNLARMENPINLYGRFDLYKTVWLMKNNIIRERMIGTGLLPALYYGNVTTAYFESIRLGLSENQVLVWINIFGWIITGIILCLIVHKVAYLYRTFKNSASNNNWVGWGLFLSWVALFIAYFPNNDQMSLIPLLFALTGIYMQEKINYYRM